MPRVIRCAECDTKLYSGPGSLGEGKTVCRVCRRKKRPPVAASQPIPEQLACPTCGTVFAPYRNTQRYCRPGCRPGNRVTRPKAPTTARGYGAAHQRERKMWKPKVEAGMVDCARCGIRIQPGQPWDLGHTDDRTGYNGPECRSCNRAAGARKRHELAPSATSHLRWDWQDCADCGARCYGKRCIDCHRAGAGRKAKRWAEPKPLLNRTCADCGALHARRSAVCEPCSVKRNRENNKNLYREREGKELDGYRARFL